MKRRLQIKADSEVQGEPVRSNFMPFPNKHMVELASNRPTGILSQSAIQSRPEVIGVANDTHGSVSAIAAISGAVPTAAFRDSAMERTEGSPTAPAYTDSGGRTFSRQGNCVGCAACCKFIILQVNPQYMEADKRAWIEMHGIHLFEQNGGAWARITSTCTNLTDEGKCGIYETRPQACIAFPSVQVDIDLVDQWAGERVCSYSFSEEVPA